MQQFGQRWWQRWMQRCELVCGILGGTIKSTWWLTRCSSGEKMSIKDNSLVLAWATVGWRCHLYEKKECWRTVRICVKWSRTEGKQDQCTFEEDLRKCHEDGIEYGGLKVKEVAWAGEINLQVMCEYYSWHVNFGLMWGCLGKENEVGR